MPAVTLIHISDAQAFVRDELLPPLPALGFDRAFRLPNPGSESSAIDSSAAVLVVVTTEAARSADFAAAAGRALRSRTPVVVVYRSLPAVTTPVLGELSSAVAISHPATAPARALWLRLGPLLPPPDAEPDGNILAGAMPIEWGEAAFTELLTASVAGNDFTSGAALVATFVAHLRRSDRPYPAAHAIADLDVLRAQQQFRLMRDYADAAFASDPTNFTVRRQLGQALIELKDFDRAIDVLRELASVTPPGHDENHEAHGLLGRAYKQRYIDEGEAARPGWLTNAISEYWKVFAEQETRIWQGVNAASCLLRAAWDGVAVPPEAQPPEQIAERVIGVLDARRARADEPLEPWDYATETEAYIDLGQLDRAEASLREYLAHPRLRPFEVSSTYRQFDEVVQLGRSPAGQVLLDRLLECVTRLRAGGRIGTADADTKRFLARLADPDWTPGEVPDLMLGTRLGTVVSFGGSARTIEALLRDPRVISIEESRPAAPPDCAQSLEFVRVQESYGAADDPYPETGARALVAIIDNGIDVLHEAFLDADADRRSRIVGVWDQTDPGPDPSGAVPFGRLHTVEDIAGYVRDGVAPARLAGSSGHGTQVAGVAAGRKCTAFAGGVAPDARLLIVISSFAEPTGYSEALLNALTFIDETATSLDLPVVVNLSQGMNAGAHDGQSALEVAFDEFCNGGRRRGRVVVKSAGNERSKRGHAKLTVPPGGADDLIWRCPPGWSRKVNLELWWRPENEYRFRLQSPRGEVSDWIGLAQPKVEDYFKGQGEYLIELVPSHVDNDDALLRVQFACGNSDRPDPDEWSLAIEAVRVRVGGDMHAWIERDSGPLTEFVNHDTEEMTITVPGTARSAITVGAVVADRPVRIASFSSFGPTRAGKRRPDICAPGIDVATATRGNGAAVCEGTSMAAPHVTGAVALLLSRAVELRAPLPTATQVRGLLRRNTMFDNTYWDRGQGFGVLDVTKLLDAGLLSLT